MKKLLKTTPYGLGKKRHSHVVYSNDEDGVGLVGEAEGHTHELVFIPPTEDQFDEMGNLVAPGMPGYFQVAPGGVDAHIHELTEYDNRKRNRKGGDSQQTIAEMCTLFKTALSVEEESIRKGRESEDFYYGKQWDDSDRGYLENSGRACVTINLLQKNVDELLGYQIQQRTDIRYLPIEGGDQRIADILNILVKNITEQCYFEREESKVFKDAVITGRGVYNLYVEFNDLLEPEIKIERYQWDMVAFGAHEKEDLSDCEHLSKHKMFSKGKIEQLWPEKADDVKRDLETWLLGPTKMETVYPTDNYAHSDNKIPVAIGTTQMVDVAKKEFRVVEQWRRVYKRVRVVTNPDEGFTQNVENWAQEDVDQLKTMPGFFLVERTLPRMRITKACGNVILSDENTADLPVNDFFMVPVYAKKRGNEFVGVVEAGKDPQREINKRHSQAIDIGNRMAAYGWFIDDNTFPDVQAKNKFKQNSSTPGFVQEVTDSKAPPTQVEGTRFPDEIVELMNVSAIRLQEIMNITVIPEGANESGAALLQKQKLKLAGNEYLFDSASFAKKKIGRLLPYLIQRYYTPERIFRILINQNVKSQVTLAGQPMDDFSEEEILQLLETADLTRYDVAVSEATYSPTVRLANFLILSDLQTKGYPIPPEVLISLMDMPDSERKRIIDGIAAQNQAQANAAEQASIAEMAKPLISRGIIPPVVQQKLGLTEPVVPMQNQANQNTGTDPLVN